MKCFVLGLSLAIGAAAQTSPLTPSQQVVNQANIAALQSALSAGTVLTSSSNVMDSVNIEAVMLPWEIARRVFGREVANNYAVIEVNIANRNPDAAFILHSLFIDYSQWGLANGMGGYQPYLNPTAFTSAANSREVSSVEYRIIRGEMLDRQPLTKRNLAINSIKALGAVGTAFAFSFSPAVVQGIGAWNGAVVPSAETLVPDGMTAQINRISDYGFRNNKVISQQSADIVVAFFPVKHFLSPSLEKGFLRSPSLFFNPLLLALDPKTRGGVEKVLENAIGKKDEVDAALRGVVRALANTDGAELQRLNEEIQSLSESIRRHRKLLGEEEQKLAKNIDSDAYATAQTAAEELKKTLNGELKELKSAQEALNSKFDTATLTATTNEPAAHDGKAKANDTKASGQNQAANLYRFLTQISLSKLAVVVGGSMTVDELTVPASITNSCFDKPSVDLWGVAGKKTCVVQGRFLLRGTPRFIDADPEDIGVSNVTVVPETSAADTLRFTYDLKAPIDPPKFNLVVTRDGRNGTSVDSMPYVVAAKSLLVSAPEVVDVTVEGSGAEAKVLLSGKNFYSFGKDHQLKVMLHPVKGDDVGITSPSLDSLSKITLPAGDLQGVPAGCYRVVVKAGVAKVDSGTKDVKVEAGSGGAKTVTAVAGCTQ